MSSCVLCEIPIDFHRPQEYAKLSERGCIGINNASKERQLETPELVYSESSPIYVHVKCRSKHNNPKAIKSALKHSLSADVKQKKLRSHISFDYKTHCLLCGVFIDHGDARKHRKRSTSRISYVLTLEFQETLQTHCAKRQDEWADAVRSRLEAIHDLPAEEALYHRDCYSHFSDGRSIPSTMQGGGPLKKVKRSRPKSSTKVAAFHTSVTYLEENDDETITLDQLHAIMKERSGLSDGDVYTHKQLQHELERHFGSSVSITTIRQQPNIVTLTSNVRSIIQEAHMNAAKADLTNMNGLIIAVGE